MFKSKKIVDYVSPIDIYCGEFDKSHPLSASQQAEIKKYRRVYALRDRAGKTNKETEGKD
jgi:hypothetical protein